MALSAVNGKVIMRDQKVLAVDEQQLIADAGKYAEGIGQRAAKEFLEIHGTNAVYMEEGKL